MGAVLLDFGAAFDIIDHSLLFTPPAMMWIKSYLSNRTQRVFSNIIQVFGILLGSPLAVAKAAAILPGVHTEHDT